ncbi:MAG: hypothetical protein KAV87_64995 [Desulfobacteraceae bacterium]|nr:hypothetical protein [Desulfobacteraceae bacterium]
MADYPGALHDWDDVEDEVDTITGAHMNNAHAEIIAIQQEQIDFRSRFYAYKPSAWQGITAGAWRRIDFESELFDEKGEYDSASLHRFTPQKTGYYLFQAGISWNSFETGKYCKLCFYRTGNRFGELAKFYHTTAGQGQTISAIIHVTTAQYVDVRAYVNLASSKSILNGYNQTYFSGHRIS